MLGNRCIDRQTGMQADRERHVDGQTDYADRQIIYKCVQYSNAKSGLERKVTLGMSVLLCTKQTPSLTTAITFSAASQSVHDFDESGDDVFFQCLSLRVRLGDSCLI